MVHSFLVLRTHSVIQLQLLPPLFLQAVFFPLVPSGGVCDNVLKELWLLKTKTSGKSELDAGEAV